MTKTKPTARLSPEPPLHVELSPGAAAALKTIRARYSWNKKTAVETALAHFAKSGGQK